MSGYLMRDPGLVAIGRRDRFIFCHKGEVATFDDVDAPALSKELERLVGPVADVSSPVVDALVERGWILTADDPETLGAERERVMVTSPGYHLSPREPVCGQLVLGLTGTVISGLMAPYVLSLGFSHFQRELDVVCTEASRSFVQPELFEYYGVRTWSNAFVRREGKTVPHIALGKDADVVAVMPATAGFVARLASGACSDLLSLVATASAAPVIVGPTMNTAMWDNPAVRRNVDQLRADGVYVVEPTFFFEAAELVKGAPPLCGMLGVFWGGPAAMMDTIAAVLADAR